MNARGLAVLYFAHQAIPAIAAAHAWRARQRLPADSELILLLDHPPGWPPARIAEAKALLDALASPFPFVRTMLPDAALQQRLVASSRPLRSSSRAVAGMLGDTPIRELYYPHDMTFAPQILAYAFPDASRVCFGDALGVVYSRRYFEQISFSPLRRALFRARRAAATALGWLPPFRDAHAAVLVLPADPGGDYLAGKDLFVPAREDVRSLLVAMSAAVLGLADETARFLATPGPHFVMLLGNLTEAGITSADSEVELFRRAIERHAPAGASVLLKPHPGADPIRTQRLSAALPGFRVSVFPQALVPIPIEIAFSLVERSTILSLSYASISLRYLYAKPVIHVLDQGLIDEWTLPGKRVWMSESNRQYLAILEALDGWDGSSPLLSGPPS